MTNCIHDGFAYNFKGILPDRVPLRLASNYKFGLQTLAKPSHRPFDLLQQRALYFPVVHDQDGRAKTAKFEIRRGETASRLCHEQQQGGSRRLAILQKFELL